MANWQKEIVLATDKITVPQGKSEADYKYDKAHAQIKQMIMCAR